ncbi:septum site-determining protein MinC [Bacillus pakistanensis]|uniref:Probable septum site-determining protein MinC n=1 Tax=Rossellomorea pakistanensis TaxID=992288 RepID=A0ABS2NAF4_9BACI|nr:septum site-determining protein MinC [Bacillus pakistanensis]MBM7584840.1 septum site-determining protein MinC [Bacillus pakistanensis]
MIKKHNILIKGTKDGLTLHLNDQCSYEELKKELDSKLTAQYHHSEDRPLMSVNIQTGNRYLTEGQEQELREIVSNNRNLIVEQISSNVMTKVDANKLIEESDIYPITGVIRSGQVIEVPGDLLIIGDVNPGGTVKAAGNIYILGVLKGVAHAGCSGNDEAVIVASQMTPTQLRISEQLNRSPDHLEKEEGHEMECAYIDDSNQIVVDRLQVLRHIRPNISSFKGGR